MEINISDEMIEKMVREQVKARINLYMTENAKSNPYWIWDMCKDSVRSEVQKIITREFIEDACREVSQNNIAEKIVDSFAEKIARCFEY